MGAQRHNSRALSGLSWPPASVLLIFALFLPTLTLDSLLCYFCPLQLKNKSCSNITSQCLPSQRCSSSRGRYGSVHVLSAQGCVDAELCGSHEMITYHGVEFNVSHSCCCRDKCNTAPKSGTSLKEWLGMMEAEAEPDHDAEMEELWSSCENFTASMITPPDNKS